MQQRLEVGDIVTFDSEHDGYPPDTPFTVALIPLTAAQRERFEEWKRCGGQEVAAMQKEIQA